MPGLIMEEILAEMREPLANGTLNAQRTVLKSAVDHIVVGRDKAELYYLFPCAALYQVPPALFIIKGSTFQPLVVTF